MLRSLLAPGRRIPPAKVMDIPHRGETPEKMPDLPVSGDDVCSAAGAAAQAPPAGNRRRVLRLPGSSPRFCLLAWRGTEIPLYGPVANMVVASAAVALCGWPAGARDPSMPPGSFRPSPPSCPTDSCIKMIWKPVREAPGVPAMLDALAAAHPDNPPSSSPPPRPDGLRHRLCGPGRQEPHPGDVCQGQTYGLRALARNRKFAQARSHRPDSSPALRGSSTRTRRLVHYGFVLGDVIIAAPILRPPWARCPAPWP